MRSSMRPPREPAEPDQARNDRRPRPASPMPGISLSTGRAWFVNTLATRSRAYVDPAPEAATLHVDPPCGDVARAAHCW